MASLSYQARKRLPSSDFALPGERKFPIEDAAHARAALQMAGGARSGKPQPSGIRAEVERKVHERFPGIGKRPSLRGAAHRSKRKEAGDAPAPSAHHSRIADIFSHR